MNKLPEDPMMLASSINMLLRDGQYEDLDDLCAAFDVERSDIDAKLAAIGMAYDPTQNKVR